MTRVRQYLFVAVVVAGFALVVWICSLFLPVGGGAVSTLSFRRVVSLGPALTEAVFAVGGGHLLVGRTRYCDFPPEALEVPVVGGYTDVDVEKVLLAKPDLVVVSPGPGNREAAEQLRRRGVRLLVVPLRTVEDVLEGILVLGNALGCRQRARETVSLIRADLAAVKVRAEEDRRVTALLVVSHEPMVLAAEGSFPDELLSIAGGENLAPKSSKHYVQADVEWLSAHPPEVVVDVSTAHAGSAADSAAVRSIYGQIPGWRGGVRVVVVKDDAITVPGPRLGVGAMVLFDALHGVNDAFPY